mmetsp:Transcript_18312/g.39924  ORF Transcript_18312/g.39924 Transcript_18312/m.39924 type:complete len:205 (+) Transcript_18312:100-714(+)
MDLNLTWQVSIGKDRNTHHFMSDQSKDSHHRRASVVQLNVAFLVFPFVSLLVPTEIKLTVAIIAEEFRLAGPVAVGEFGHEDEGDQLSNDILAVIRCPKCGEGGEAIRDFLGTWEPNASSCRQIANTGKHGHSSVLQLLVAKILESDGVRPLRIAVGQHHGIKVPAFPNGRKSPNLSSIGSGHSKCRVRGGTRSYGGKRSGAPN